MKTSLGTNNSSHGTNQIRIFGPFRAYESMAILFNFLEFCFMFWQSWPFKTGPSKPIGSSTQLQVLSKVGMPNLLIQVRWKMDGKISSCGCVDDSSKYARIHSPLFDIGRTSVWLSPVLGSFLNSVLELSHLTMLLYCGHMEKKAPMQP